MFLSFYIRHNSGFKFCHNFKGEKKKKKYLRNFFVINVTTDTTVNTVTTVKIWFFLILLQFVFLSLVPIWILDFFLTICVFEFTHNFSFRVLSQFEFFTFFSWQFEFLSFFLGFQLLNFVTICVLSIYLQFQSLSFVPFCVFKFLTFVPILVLSFVTILRGIKSVPEFFCHNCHYGHYCHYCHNCFYWILSQFEFGHNLGVCVCVFLNFVTIWIF